MAPALAHLTHAVFRFINKRVVHVHILADNARLLAQIRLWVPMKRTWPGFGAIFSRLHMKTAIGKKAGSHVR